MPTAHLLDFNLMEDLAPLCKQILRDDLENTTLNACPRGQALMKLGVGASPVCTRGTWGSNALEGGCAVPG